MCCNEDDWRAAEMVLGAQSSPCEPSGPGTTGTKRVLIISWTQKGAHGTHTDPESIEYVRGPFSSMLTLKLQKKSLFSSCQSRCSVCGAYRQLISILQVSVKPEECPESPFLWSGTTRKPCASVPLAWS